MSKTTRFTKLPKSYVTFFNSDARFFPVAHKFVISLEAGERSKPSTAMWMLRLHLPPDAMATDHEEAQSVKRRL